MATVANLMVKIGSDIKGLEKGISKAQRKLQDAGRSMQRIGSRLTMGVTAPLAAIGGQALKTSAEFEKLQIQMNTLAGSAEEGAAAFDRLQKFSAGTPFQMKDLVRANNILVGMGQTMGDAFDNIQMLGDVSSATGANISELAVTFGQASAEGELMTRDIREFISRGVPLTKLLADSMGVAKSQIFDLASQGKITFDVLQKALKDATTGTGIYAGATEDAANTLGGIFSTLRDNVSRALNEIGKSLSKTFDIKGLMKDMITNIQSGIDWFNSLSEETRRMAFYVAGLLGASGPIIAALGTLSIAIGAISAPIAGVAVAVGAAATAIIQNWDSVVEYFTSGQGQKIWSTVKDTMSSFVNAVSAFWETFGSNIVSIVKGAFTTVVNLVGVGLEGLSVVLDVWSGKWLTNWDQFLDDTESSFSDTFGSGGYLESIAQSWWQRFMQNDPIVNAGNWISTVLGLDGPIQQASKEAKKESQQTANSISSVYQNLANRLQNISFSFGVESTSSGGALDEKIGLSQQTLDTFQFATQLLNNNLFPAVQRNNNALKQYANTWKFASQILNGTWAPAVEKARDSINNFNNRIQNLQSTLQGLEINSPAFRDLRDEIFKTQVAMFKFTNKMSSAGQDLKSGFNKAIGEMAYKFSNGMNVMQTVGSEVAKMLPKLFGQMATALGAHVGKMLAGVGNEFYTGFEKVILIVLDFVNQLATLIGGIGGLLLLIPGFQAQGAAMLAGAAALAALASGFSAGINKRIKNRRERAQNNKGASNTPRLAQGGLAFGPTMAVVGDNRGARSNPEVIAPLDKLQSMMGGMSQHVTVTGQISGSTIHLANERGKDKFR